MATENPKARARRVGAGVDSSYFGEPSFSEGSWMSSDSSDADLSGPAGRLVLDIRRCTPSARRAIVVAVVEALLTLDVADSLVVVCEHEPVGLGYGMDLRKETRGRFEYYYDQRSDGSWVALIRRKSG